MISRDMPVQRKITRLSSENYRGCRAYFVTICCDYRAPYLAERATSSRALEILLECAVGHSFLLHAFCLMPDHVHMLAQATADQSDLRKFVKLFKQRTAFEFRRTHNGRLWEKSYYDHILRDADSVEEVACYIWWNPVRKKLCDRPQDFAFSGSQTIDWIRRSSACPLWSAPWKQKEPA